MSRFIDTLYQLIIDISWFWILKFRDWWDREDPVDLWLNQVQTAESFEDWEEAALHLDNLLGLDQWRNTEKCTHFDHQLIHHHVVSLVAARQQGDYHEVINLMRSGFVRNLGNITAPKLYNVALAGTKYVIEEYVSQVAEAIEDINALPTSPTILGGDAVLTAQAKLDFLHDMRQAFGRTSLVLQGGSIFGLYHLGVVKALYLRGLLPRIITGTATGALIAALVSIHREDELLGVLTGDSIDLSAFAGRVKSEGQRQDFRTRFETLLRRIRRWRRNGYFLDIRVLEECVKANVGDLTFEEAYNRSKRVLNITVATDSQRGVPTLLNYLTAPNVLIWTAAIVSNVGMVSVYGHRETKLLCKDAQGNIVPWASANTIDFRHWSQVSYTDRDSPLLRVAELFNANHFIVSQARPFLMPFLQSDMHGPSVVETGNLTMQMLGFLTRMIGLEIRHRLRQMDALQLLPTGIRRFLVDEHVPGASLTIVPNITPSDFSRLFETPTPETIPYWIQKGERAVWPAVTALKVRCAIENELDRSYQIVRRIKAGDLRRRASTANSATGLPELGLRNGNGPTKRGVST